MFVAMEAGCDVHHIAIKVSPRTPDCFVCNVLLLLLLFFSSSNQYVDTNQSV